jgi:hypothetical protein
MWWGECPDPFADRPIGERLAGLRGGPPHDVTRQRAGQRGIVVIAFNILVFAILATVVFTTSSEMRERRRHLMPPDGGKEEWEGFAV